MSCTIPWHVYNNGYYTKFNPHYYSFPLRTQTLINLGDVPVEIMIINKGDISFKY